jgi:hypothetical protein
LNKSRGRGMRNMKRKKKLMLEILK